MYLWLLSAKIKLKIGHRKRKFNSMGCNCYDVAHDIGASFTFSNSAHVRRSVFLYKHGLYITIYISLGRYWDIYFKIVLKISTIHRIKRKKISCKIGNKAKITCRSVTQISTYISINLNKYQNIRRKVPKFERIIGHMTDISYLIGNMRSYHPDGHFVRSTCPEYSVEREKRT